MRRLRVRSSYTRVSVSKWSANSIAGGAIAGIGIAFLAGVMEKTDGALQHWAEKSNPFYVGPNANLLSVLPFLMLTLLLFFVGREKLLGGPKRPA